jgi:hypothetical protein
VLRVSLCVFFVLLTSLSAAAQNVTISLPVAGTGSGAAPSGAPAAVPQPVSVAETRAIARGVREALRDVVLRGALDAAITGRNAAPVQGVSLEVGKEGETVGKAQLAWRLDDYDSAVDVILKGPINQSAGVPVTDRGLASGASVTLGYNLTLWGSSVPATVAGTVQSLVSNAPPGSSLSPLEALIATGIAVEEAGAQAYADTTLQALARDSTRSAFASRDPRLIAFALRDDRKARLTRTLSIRGSYSVGSTTFKFAEIGDAIAERSDTKTDNAAAISAAYIQLLRDGAAEAPLMLISAGVTQGDRWKGGRSRQICTPLDLAEASECRTLVVGAPMEQSEKSVEVDIRTWAYAQKLGINPHFSYDRVTKQWTSEVGLSYLVLKEPVNGLPQLDSKALTVGIRVGSRPEEEGGVYASVFFGTVLSK